MHEKRIKLFEAALKRGGLMEGVKFLNATVDHRYTGIYRLRDGDLVNVGFFDRSEKVTQDQLRPSPLTTSLSPFVLDGAKSGPTPHLHQYCVPVVRADGYLLGTLCHFDVERHDLPDEEFAFLEAAGKIMAAYLPQS